MAAEWSHQAAVSAADTQESEPGKFTNMECLGQIVGKEAAASVSALQLEQTTHTLSMRQITKLFPCQTNTHRHIVRQQSSRSMRQQASKHCTTAPAEEELKVRTCTPSWVGMHRKETLLNASMEKRCWKELAKAEHHFFNGSRTRLSPILLLPPPSSPM